MTEYSVSTIYASDKIAQEEVNRLLKQEGIRRDDNLDYTCGIYDSNNKLVGTGSCFKSTLRCLAIDKEYQGEGLMNLLVTHLIDYQQGRGNAHLFVYTKTESVRFFTDLGFFEIARVGETLVFMENRPNGFRKYLNNLEKGSAQHSNIASVVINANPFTLGHRHLIEEASRSSDLLHLFMVSEDASLFPFSVRKKLIQEGTADFSNIIYHETGPYMISTSTFPSYFLKDDQTVIETQALLDIEIFTKIAEELAITSRFVGEEPFSTVTNIYNTVMKNRLPFSGISCFEIPRFTIDGEIISASKIRQLIQRDQLNLVKELVPSSTFEFLHSAEGKEIIARIRDSDNVIHY
ncbi:[citrate (pro-3S)-lyase] ligase [Enterococcus sp. 669A]|uniref:[Citrate [pro-3S]-lyase] ligase n=1 Tax=Candidatus Enterococcus moelleringii TaxID=2815325 RepID=A0ABS3L5Z9_9ENTE|nr:[citrate (pro-3S)-lyase] ligase [Enterococcus sp. 669A]MBO1304533.1 [citrate (pro-3S)-lyase] ligase [Enterococcus sp. 669A]